MQDPSHGVATPLQNHVHLISGHRFPLLPSLNVEQAFRYLLDAPTIVKQTAPMSWQYVQAPQDGTVWLEWIPQRNGEYRFASDGYVWGDPEQAYRQDFGGYTIEWMVHTVGYRPNFDQMASHARTRYHFVAKNPNVNAAPPDPSLWIVHYHQTEQSRMLPSGSVPVNMQVRQGMNERRWLEYQGRLERKEFMLHDREHWPNINLPNSSQMPHMPQPGMAGNPMMQQHANQQRYPQYAYPQGGAPPAKRARHSGPSMSGAGDGLHEISLADEEDTSSGDFFDHLTPREISMARYIQHHRWMEEVFSSPYASSQIVPPDLGLGLMGELKGLTDGILEPPSVGDIDDRNDRPIKAKEAQPFSNLKKEQVEEFSGRVKKHLEEGYAEIERMKKEHAEKMAEWKKTKTLIQAEKRLRYATWEGHEDAVPAYRLDVLPANGHHDDGAPPETVEDVVKDVETLLGVKIQGYKDATMVEKGGLEKDEQQPKEDMIQENGMSSEKQMTDLKTQEPMMSGANGNAAPGQPTATSETETKGQALEPKIPNDVPQSTFEVNQPEEPQAQDEQALQSLGGDALADQDGLDDMGDMEMGDTSLMDDIDMDMDTGEIDFVEHTPLADDETAIDDSTPAPSVLVDVQAPSEPVPDAQIPGPSTLEEVQVAQQPAAETQQQQDALPSTTVEEALAPEPTVSADPIVGEAVEIPAMTENAPVMEEDSAINEPGDNMFDDGTFDDLTNMDDGNGDDGLIDFDGGMGMGDSAFDDALGMDTPTVGDTGVGEGEDILGGDPTAPAQEGS